MVSCRRAAMASQTWRQAWRQTRRRQEAAGRARTATSAGHGEDRLSSSSPVLATPSDSEMSGVSLIYATRTAEVQCDVLYGVSAEIAK